MPGVKARQFFDFTFVLISDVYKRQDPAFAVNVEALTAAQPKDLDASEIEVRLGATWIDKERCV